MGGQSAHVLRSSSTCAVEFVLVHVAAHCDPEGPHHCLCSFSPFLTHPVFNPYALYSTMESSWNKRGYGSAISRSVEVWLFGAKILYKEIKLRKVGGVHQGTSIYCAELLPYYNAAASY